MFFNNDVILFVQQLKQIESDLNAKLLRAQFGAKRTLPIQMRLNQPALMESQP